MRAIRHLYQLEQFYGVGSPEVLRFCAVHGITLKQWRIGYDVETMVSISDKQFLVFGLCGSTAEFSTVEFC